jgi:hypothetical protein
MTLTERRAALLGLHGAARPEHGRGAVICVARDRPLEFVGRTMGSQSDSTVPLVPTYRASIRLLRVFSNQPDAR